MSTQIKNGCIMRVSPFFLPDQAAEERLSHELALRLEEQLVLGKIKNSDLRTITKIHFPKKWRVRTFRTELPQAHLNSGGTGECIGNHTQTLRDTRAGT